MAYGDYNKRRVSGRPPNSGRGLGVRSKEIVKKIKNASIKNQIRSIQRLLRKVKKRTTRQKVKDKAKKISADIKQENGSTPAEESVTDAGSVYGEQIPQNMKRKIAKHMRFYAKLQETQQVLAATKSIAKKKQRRKRNISGQTLKDLSSLAESLPIFSDKKSVTQIHESAKVNCKSRQKLVAKETKQLAAVLAHPEFVSNPFSAVQQHLENTLGPQINTESKPKHGNKQKSSKGSKKKKGSKASPSSTVHAMEL